MKIISGISGMLLATSVVLLSGCYKDRPEINILATGDFAETTTPLKEAADFPIGVGIDYTPMISDPNIRMLKIKQAIIKKMDSFTILLQK
ncbi:MAG: hypothetical protein WDO16_03160 [Bacteroidota bacterium]